MGQSVSTVSGTRIGDSVFYQVISACVFFQGVEDVRKDEGIDFLRPKEIEMFEMEDFFRDGVTWELFEHDLDID